MHVCKFTHVCKYIWVWVCTCLCLVCMHAFWVCVNAHVWIYDYIFTHVYIGKCVWKNNAELYACMCIYIQICIYAWSVYDTNICLYVWCICDTHLCIYALECMHVWRMKSWEKRSMYAYAHILTLGFVCVNLYMHVYIGMSMFMYGYMYL